MDWKRVGCSGALGFAIGPALGLLAAIGGLGGCAARQDQIGVASDPAPQEVARAMAFRDHLAASRYQQARSMMAEDPRRWFGHREGEGQPWRIGPGEAGPWAAWDRTLNKRTEAVRWRLVDGGAALIYRETNDYFLLLGRGWVTNETVYLFGDDGRIEGVLIRPSGAPRPQGRTEDFLAWARANEPGELAELMPAGDIDPSSDHAERMRALLQRWRADRGLPPIL